MLTISCEVIGSLIKTFAITIDIVCACPPPDKNYVDKLTHTRSLTLKT